MDFLRKEFSAMLDAWKVQLFDGQNLVKVVGVVLGRGMWHSQRVVWVEKSVGVGPLTLCEQIATVF